MEGANEHCIGPQSAEAGIAPSCQGCPNAAICAAGARGPDPDIPLIADRLRAVRHKVMVVSGKGGVGKSTLSKEIALSLGMRGFQVGLLDLDICGPSLPRLTGARGEEAHPSADGIEPVLIADNVTMMSMHYLMGDKTEAVMFRGGRKNGVIKLFLKDVLWGDLDVLLIDTPPGTSDEHITASHLLTQTPGGVDGVVLVTTPQRVAEADVRREVTFCHKAHLPVLGLVENMSGFVCPNCAGVSHIFPPQRLADGRAEGAGERLSREFGIPLWAAVPLDPTLMRACEEGVSLAEYIEAHGAKDGSTSMDEAKEKKGGSSSLALQKIFQVTDKLIEALHLSPPENG